MASEARGEPANSGAPKARKAVPMARGGGVYIPPFRLRQMMQEAEQQQGSEQHQRLMWEALRKSLNGIINKVNASNIKEVLPELFRENLNRGQGLLCQCLMRAQAASPNFTPVFAAMMAIINTRLPEIGLLLASRVVQQFKRAYKRNDKPVCLTALAFIAHLVNQRMLNEVLALEILLLLLETPTDDSVEMAITFVRNVGAAMEESSRAALQEIFERFKAILQEGYVNKKTQFLLEKIVAERRKGFEAAGFPAVKPELDLVEEDDQIEHEIELTDELDVKRLLNVFKYDPEYEKSEQEWDAIKRELLGDDDEEENAEDSEDDEGSEDGEAADGAPSAHAGPGGQQVDITDKTSTNLVNLRRTLYLTIMSSASFEEAGHKLLKMQLPESQAIELCSMICECCSQEKTFLRFYALLAQRFCVKFVAYSRCFEDCFVRNFKLCHRLETNKIRNLGKLFAHLLGTDAISWEVMSEVKITEESTTSASRIFIKCLMQELSEYLGLRGFQQKLDDPEVAPHLDGLFPQDSMENMRFSINFFTAVGLGGLTDKLREAYASAQQQAKAYEQERALRAARASPSSSSSGSDSSSSSRSRSRSRSHGRSRRRSYSPQRKSRRVRD